MKTTIILFIALMFITAGCGNQPTSVKQETSTPTGSIQGLVNDYNTNNHLSGVIISTTSGGGMVETKSDTSGIYRLAGLPTGAFYPVYFSLSGYGTSIYRTLLGNTPPTFPQGNALSIVNAYMYPANGTVKGTAYLNGNPIQSAHIMIDMRNITGNSTGFIGINSVIQTTTDATGGYALKNVPGSYDGNFNGSGPRIIGWYVDSNGIYYADSVPVSVYSGATSFAPDLDLACNLPKPDIVASSQDISADNSGGGTPLIIHIGVSYNQPMDQTPGNEPSISPYCPASQTGFMWTGTTAGQFTVTVNANKNCAGSYYRINSAQNVCGRGQNPYLAVFN